jgi:selenocysteine lyase/cysteine desulfurase
MNNQNDHARKLTLSDLRNEIVGIDTCVPLLDGTERRYVFLDNAASTPTFRRVLKCVESFLPWYSGVHRGTGFKSVVATEVFDRAHEVVGTFVGADLSANHVIFTKNTTECVNKLANRFPFSPDDIVVTTAMEHHSNLLPWRKFAQVIHVGITNGGYLDLDELNRTLVKYAGRVKLVAVSGASNITGICSPIHAIAERAHAVGAKIFVDAAQLVPHRPVNMLPDDYPRHIDFLAFSAHKMYAPFGIGVLIGPHSFFAEGEPDMVGGGVVDVVTLDDVVWNETRNKDEAGSPNVVGGVALAEAINMMQQVGMDTIAAHEQHLLEYAFSKLKKLSGLKFYGPTEDVSDKVGVIAFTVDGMHHSLVSAILGAEAGIGVRNGYFCAQPYVKKLLNVLPEEEATGCGTSGDKTNVPGMVRASFGCYTNDGDIDLFVDAMERILRREYRGVYVQDETTGAFHPQGMSISLKKYFSFFDSVSTPMERAYSEAS